MVLAAIGQLQKQGCRGQEVTDCKRRRALAGAKSSPPPPQTSHQPTTNHQQPAPTHPVRVPKQSSILPHTTTAVPVSPKRRRTTTQRYLANQFPYATAMSRRLFDDWQIANAMQNEVVPALERFAENEALRDRALRRFERDEPPRYVSSTEEDDDYDDEIPSLDELTQVLDEPLSDRDLDTVAIRMERHYQPGVRYEVEAAQERDRLALAARLACENTRQYFVQYGSAADGRAGDERVNIIIRRNIKRRWEKLGVWNPEWGFPDRVENPQPNDDTRTWKWPWQHGDAAADWSDKGEDDLGAMARNPRHPVTRAIELRRGRRRSEHSPVIPHSRLQTDASASQGESFITSRPWFMFQVEGCEDWERLARVPLRTHHFYGNKAPFLSVRDQWRERGDWKEEWPYEERHQSRQVIGWKWRHESPSPEPEDHDRLDNPTLDLTPSEIDALEAVRPPTPPPPPRTPDPPLIGPRCSDGRFSLGFFERPWGAPPPSPPPPYEPPSPVRWARLCQTQEEEPLEQPSPPRRQTRPRRNREAVIAQPPPSRRTRQRQSNPLPSQPPLRRSPRISAKAAALAATQPSRVSKPKAPARSKGRPKKKATR